MLRAASHGAVHLCDSFSKETRFVRIVDEGNISDSGLSSIDKNTLTAFAFCVVDYLFFYFTSVRKCTATTNQLQTGTTRKHNSHSTSATVRNRTMDNSEITDSHVRHCLKKLIEF